MSTAGAAASWRTVTLGLAGAGLGDWSLAYTVSAGLPAAVRCATTDLLWFLRRLKDRDSTGALLAGALAARMATVFWPALPGTVAHGGERARPGSVHRR